MASLLKRKRSDSELSFSSSITLSSPPRPTTDFGSSASIADCDTLVPSMFRGRSAPLYLPGRTLKRFRNSRPSDTEVHEHTLNLLYAAQQSACRQLSPCPEQDAQLNDQADAPSSPGQHRLDGAAPNQPSLYSFWKLPQAASRQPPQPVAVARDYQQIAGTGASRAIGGVVAGDNGDLCMASAEDGYSAS